MKRDDIVIGASEAAAVLNLDPYETPLGLYRKKLGLVPPEPPSKAMELGIEVEHALARLFEKQQGITVEHWSSMFDDDDAWLRFTPDRVIPPHVMTPAFRERWEVVDGEWLLLEHKTAGLATRRPLHEVQMRWGAPGSDDVPRGYAVQCMVQAYGLNRLLQSMGVGFCTRVILKPLVAGMADPDYLIRCAPDTQRAIIDGLRRFVDEHLARDVPPAPVTADDWDSWLESRARPKASATILDNTPERDAAVRRFAFAKAIREAAEKAYAASYAQLADAIGDCYGVDGPWGRVTYTKGSSGEKLNAPAFGADAASILERRARGEVDEMDVVIELERLRRHHSRDVHYGRQLRAAFKVDNWNGFDQPGGVK